MAVIWALAAAFSFGVSDFLAREAGQREGSIRTLYYLQLLGTPVAALLVLSGGPFPWGRVFSPVGLAAVMTSLVSTSGAILLYRALVKGPLLIVSPVASSFAAVTIALSLLSGERPTPTQSVGMLLTLVGVTLAAATTGNSQPDSPVRSIQRHIDWASSGIASALGASLFFGLSVWLLRFIVCALGDQPTVLVMRLGSLAWLSAFFLASRRPFRLGSASSLRWLLPMGVLDTVANWFVNLGLLSGLTSVVSVIVSLFSVVTILLGYVISKERITRIQQVGILITLVGVALVSI